MRAPILPVGTRVTAVIYQDAFVQKLQDALNGRGYSTGSDAPGSYGPGTATALKRFQDDHPVSTLRDQYYRVIGYEVAACATYNALGLLVHEVYPVPGVTGSPQIVDLINALAAGGHISLRCPGVPVEPTEPSKPDLGQKVFNLVLLGSSVAAIVIAVIALKKK